MKIAAYFTPTSDKKVQCNLCPHHCSVSDGKQGICLTRRNRDGILYADNYCRPISMAVDPIEKKPLYHFYPGRAIFSSGPNGCTFKCKFCQNHEISQTVLSTRELKPDEFVKQTRKSNSIGIAYTYSEPYIWFETIMDIGPKIKDLGLVNVMVTNGYMEPEPLEDLLTVVDAMNIDIKSMNEQFYKHLCKGSLTPVLNTCEKVKKHCHLEITNLLIPGENDSEEDIQKLADYITGYLGEDTPLHISRYFPRYKLGNQPTEESSLFNTWEITREKLQYVYLGNIVSGNKGDTFCPTCNTLLVKRSGYSTKISKDLGKGLDNKCTCLKCGSSINIIM
jgi:pyruvate formate lyase activating enzyme